MLKNILNLDGVHALTGVEQKAINGGKFCVDNLNCYNGQCCKNNACVTMPNGYQCPTIYEP